MLFQIPTLLFELFACGNLMSNAHSNRQNRHQRDGCKLCAIKDSLTSHKIFSSNRIKLSKNHKGNEKYEFFDNR